MASQTGVQIRVLFNHLPTIGPTITAAINAETRRAAYQIEALGKSRAPVLTGTLRRSIHVVFMQRGLMLVAMVGPSVDYAIYVEFGTRNMGARPYMRPAAEAVFPQYVDRCKAALRAVA